MSTFHKAMNIERFLDTAVQETDAQRLTRLRDALRDERAFLTRTPAGTHDHATAERNIGAIETAIAKVERNAEARRKIDAELAERKRQDADAAEQRRVKLAEEEKTRIRSEYMMANRAATADEFEAVFPDLLADHRKRRMDEATAKARAATRSML